MSLSARTIRYLAVVPRNDHEREIARIVDQKDLDGKLNPKSFPFVLGSLKLIPSEQDRAFARKYIQWRLENPIAK